MAGTTDTQSLRFGQLSDIITHTMQANLADDIAAQLDLADADQVKVLKRPVVFVRRVAAQATVAGVRAAVTFDNLPTDTHGMVNIGGAPTRVTVVSGAGAGQYMFHGIITAQYGTGTWTAGHISLWKNGTFLIGQRTAWGQRTDVPITAQVQLALTDYVELHFQHDGTGTPNITLAQLWVHKLNS